MADSTGEISWLKCLLQDLQVSIPTPSLVMCDNASTIALANNTIHHARTKHIEIDCHFVRDEIKQGQIKPCYVPTKLQLADILTKGLSKALHYGCLSKLGICDPYTMPTCGGDKGNHETTTMPNTPSRTDHEENAGTVQVQSVQRLAAPPRMKHLLNRSLIQCNKM